jgi:hypothetical protein
MQPRVLLGGLAMPESPRSHHGRLWFSNWGTRQVVAADLDGNSAVVGEGPDGLGWATSWLPDGRLLITGGEPARLQGSKTSRGSRSASKRTRAAPSQPRRTGRSLTPCCAISSDQPATAKRRHSSGTPFNS